MSPGVDDGQRVFDYALIVGTTLLAALNTLDRNDLLTPDSEFKDIALVMGLYLKVAQNFGEVLDWSDGEGQIWPNQIVTFAKEKDIQIDMPFGIESLVRQYDTGENLPRKAIDRFKFKPLVSSLHELVAGFFVEATDVPFTVQIYRTAIRHGYCSNFD